MKKLKKNSFVEGTMIAYICILITKILGAVYVVPFYKIIGTTGGILYGYAYNFYNLFLNISTSGIPTALSIIISEYNALNQINEKKYAYKVSNRIISFISFIAFIVMFVFAKYLVLFFIGDIDSSTNIESATLVIRTISLCLLIVPFLSTLRGYLQGNKYVSASSNSQLIEQVFRIFIALLGSFVVVNILHKDVSIAVAVSLLGTVISSLVAYLYLRRKLSLSKENVNKIDYSKLTITSKELVLKIIKYALPIIIVSITQNLYEVVDLKLILKALYMIGYSSSETEVIASVVVTWASKICMVINALAMGLCASIIPYVVESFSKKDIKNLNNKFNQSINTIICVTFPIAAFIITFNKSVYYIFYSDSLYGGNILIVESLVCILFSTTLVINMILQSIRKYKLVYINTIVGLIINTLLDIPIVLLYNKIGFIPYLGTLTATIIGQLVSLLIVTISLKKEYNFNYKEVFNAVKKVIAPLITMIGVMIILKVCFNDNGSYFIRLIKLALYGIISVVVYLFVSYKNGLLSHVFGSKIDNILNRFKRR